jgi:hypothetical protein
MANLRKVNLLFSRYTRAQEKKSDITIAFLEKSRQSPGKFRSGAASLALLPEPQFYFASVEAALVRAYRVAPTDQARFRARLTFLQRSGLFGADRPGKGTRQTYGPDHLHRLVFCCELAELGVSPAVQLRLVEELWNPRIRRIFEVAEARPTRKDDTVLLMIGVSLMVKAWTGAVPNVQACSLRELADRLTLGMQEPPSDDDSLDPRVMAVNLTARLRRFHGALAAVQFKFKQPPIEPINDRISKSRKGNDPTRIQAARRRARGQQRTRSKPRG